MSEEIYWLSEKEGLQVGKKVIVKEEGKPAPRLPDGLSSDLLKSLKARGVIGALPVSASEVKTDPKVEELKSKLSNEKLKNDSMEKIVRSLKGQVLKLHKEVAENEGDSEYVVLLEDANMYLIEMIEKMEPDWKPKKKKTGKNK